MTKLLDHPLAQLTLVRAREFLREPEAIFWAVFFPIVLSVGLGLAFRERPEAVLRIAATPELAEVLRSEAHLDVTALDASAARDALRTGKVALAAERNQLVTDEPPELGVRRAGGVRAAGQVVGQRAFGVQATHQPVEQVGATVLGRPPANLRRDLAELSLGGDLSACGGVAQRLLVPLQRRGHGRQPQGDVALRLLALGRHQVEDAADVLQRPGGHRHLAGGDAGLGHLDLEAEPLDEGVLGQPLALVDRHGGSRGGQRPAVDVDPLGEPLGREVRQPVVVPGDAGVRRHGRVEGSGVLDVLVGDRVDLAWCGHAVTLGSAPTPIRQRSCGS